MLKREGRLGQAIGPPLRHTFLPTFFSAMVEEEVWLSET